jgi:arylsulfatase A-like enzyme
MLRMHGQRFARRIRLRTAGLLVAGLLVLLAACGGEPRRPNVLLISIDTLRADRLGCYGYPKPTTPTLDALAREGVLFERAVAPTSWTLPSHVTMLTGLPISVHGACDERLWARKDAHGRLVPPPVRGASVAESLRRVGYRTAGFYTFGFLDDAFGFGAGFETWERLGHTLFSNEATREELRALRMAGDAEGARLLFEEHAELLDARRRSTPEIVDRANAWLERHARDRASEPYFLFLHLFDVHDPYTAPPGFDRFGDPGYAGTVDGAIAGDRYPCEDGLPPLADQQRLGALYDGGLAYVDAELARLFRRLEELDLDEDTLVIVTSDHGEEFFEHGGAGHRRQLYVESLHVPLILRWPAGLDAGRRVKGTVGLVDVVPTILAATGARHAHPTGGIDLLPAARGEHAVGGRLHTATLLVFDRGPDGSDVLVERQTALFRGDEHVILTHCGGAAFRAERYDLARDPRELGVPHTFGPEDPEGAAVREQLEAIARGYRALRSRLPTRALDSELTAREKSSIASAGYVSGETVRSEEATERLCLEGCVFDR